MNKPRPSGQCAGGSAPALPQEHQTVTFLNPTVAAGSKAGMRPSSGVNGVTDSGSGKAPNPCNATLYIDTHSEPGAWADALDTHTHSIRITEG